MDTLSTYISKEDLTLTLYINKIRDENIWIKQGTKWEVFWFDSSHIGLLSEDGRTNITVTVGQLEKHFEKESK